MVSVDPLGPAWEAEVGLSAACEDLTVQTVGPIAFLPGAGGSPQFWKPVADRLPGGWEPILLGWPGAGDQPRDPLVGSFEDLIELTASRLSDGTNVVAQSMGGIVAVGLALRHPAKVKRLALVATSGGIDVGALGASDWRDEYRAQFPAAAAWVTETTVDYTAELKRIRVPTLLLWGDQDPISPVAVGRRLCELLPASVLRVIAGGTHEMAVVQPDDVATAIIGHLLSLDHAAGTCLRGRQDLSSGWREDRQAEDVGLGNHAPVVGDQCAELTGDARGGGEVDRIERAQRRVTDLRGSRHDRLDCKQPQSASTPAAAAGA